MIAAAARVTPFTSTWFATARPPVRRSSVKCRTRTPRPRGPSSARGGALDGIVLENLSPQTRSAFEIDDSGQTRRRHHSPRSAKQRGRAGLRPGDVVSR